MLARGRVHGSYSVHSDLVNVTFRTSSFSLTVPLINFLVLVSDITSRCGFVRVPPPLLPDEGPV